jgi:hypothetical protein
LQWFRTLTRCGNAPCLRISLPGRHLRFFSRRGRSPVVTETPHGAAIQPLESRLLLTAYTVDTLDDVSDGDFGPGQFSLREAVEQANASPGTDAIGFAPALQGGTITLNGQALVLSDSVVLAGPGARSLTVSGNDLSRIFEVTGGEVEVSGLRLSHGLADYGGAILNTTTLTLRSVELDFNYATQDGGAIFNDNGALSIVGSTLAHNHADDDGGAIRSNGLEAGPALVISNSTVSGNSANDLGGGIYNLYNYAVILSSTITGNRADADGLAGEGDTGGGLWIGDNAATGATLHNSIVAGNVRGTGTTPDDLGDPAAPHPSRMVGAVSSFNLIGDAATAGGLIDTVGGNVVGVNGSGSRDISTVLATTLADNGGPTSTHALVPGSPAINRGSNAKADDHVGQPLQTDQRGPGFPRILGGRVDIGALEAPAYTDLYGRAASGTYVIARSNGTTFQNLAAGHIPPGADWASSLLSGDFNNDGLMDLAGRSPSDGSWRVLLNTGGALAAPAVWAQFSTASSWSDLSVGDFNGDGRDDVVGRDEAGTWVVGLSTGSSFQLQTFGTWSASTSWSFVMVLDLNGDGLSDITGRMTDGRWYAALSNGASFASSYAGLWSTGPSWSHVHKGDFNGDGRHDIVGRASSGTWVVGLSTGNQFTMTAFGAWSTNVTWSDIRFGDFTGDGRTDVAGRLADGRWIVGRSTGSAFQNSAWGTWSPNVPWLQVVVGDFDGDGRDDLAGRPSSGAWYVGRSTGTKFITSSWISWSANTTWNNVRSGQFA